MFHEPELFSVDQSANILVGSGFPEAFPKLPIFLGALKIFFLFLLAFDLEIAIFNDKNNVLKFQKTIIFKIDKITLLELANLCFKSIFVFCGINNFLPYFFDIFKI